MSNRFRVYEKYSKETFKMEDDYTFRANDGGLLFTLTEVFQAPRMFTVQENTRHQDTQNVDIFEGDRVLCTLRGGSEKMLGVVSRHKSGEWIVTTLDKSQFPLGDLICDVRHKVIRRGEGK